MGLGPDHCWWRTSGTFDEPDRFAAGWRRPIPALHHRKTPLHRQPRPVEWADPPRLARMPTRLTPQAPRTRFPPPGTASFGLHDHANRLARASARRHCEPIVEGDTEPHVDWITGVEETVEVSVVERL